MQKMYQFVGNITSQRTKVKVRECDDIVFGIVYSSATVVSQRFSKNARKRTGYSKTKQELKNENNVDR